MSIEAQTLSGQQCENRFVVSLATAHDNIEACLRLRYQVFGLEQGAQLSSRATGLDKDIYDDYCKHIMVYDNRTHQVVATTRLMSASDTRFTNGFYSEAEFNLQNILAIPGNFMEVGRTCIHPDFRRGAVLALLWQGIARVVNLCKIDYLIGCASIPLSGGERYIASVMHHLRTHHFIPADRQVQPRVSLPKSESADVDDVILPTLLKGYLRQGALICGEPYWDAQFGVADVFVLLDTDKIASRYQKHFIERLQA
ncbi:MAG: GNAT family N-acyltransferase [Gammaproteobacteria bacterium]